MECNRDEAIRAKEIAEKKFTEKDIMGAKKFAIKAQSLYPGLDGIQHMLATLDVYTSAENRVSGDADWYRILGVNPKANDETVRKHYRKLALMLHPDKNKSIGAEGAFKLVSEAWSLLSDKSKRLAYDQKRNARVSQQKVPHASGCPTAPSGSNGFSNFTKSSNTNTHARAQKNTATKAGTSSGPSSSHKKKSPTFWTVCHRCKMQYEYLRMYLNHNLLCPNCHDPFFAIETPPPTLNGSKASVQRNYSQQSQQQQKNHQGASKNASTSGRNNSSTSNMGSGGFNNTDSANHNNFQWEPFSKTAGTASAAQAATVVKQAYERAKREREEVQAATKREEGLQRKNHANRKTSGFSSSGYSDGVKRRKGMEDIGAAKYGNDAVSQMVTGTGAAGSSGLSGPEQGFYGPSGADKHKSSLDSPHVRIPNLLMEKARADIHKKLNEWNKSTAESKKNGNEKPNAGEKVKDIDMVNCARLDQCKNDNPVNMTSGSNAKFMPGTSDCGLDNDLLGPMSMEVPDPDFHDFEKERTERCFGVNQVWALYDGDDGMPRYYAIIHDVISLDPLKMQIIWLNSKTNRELGSLNWVGSGFSKTCGDFRIGKRVCSNSLCSFSHKIKWTKVERGVVRIYPLKGDVWALYRNWSPAWNELTADEVIHKYDMVEVLEDYDEEFGVAVTPLVKVAGFRTVFHRHLDHREVRRIPREEMLRFSHHVPSYLLTGQEAPNAPKGCHELDPAATPLELLQVVTDIEEEDIVENEEDDGKVEKLVNDGSDSDNEEMETSCSSSKVERSGNAKERNEINALWNSRKTKEEKQVNCTEEKADG